MKATFICAVAIISMLFSGCEEPISSTKKAPPVKKTIAKKAPPAKKTRSISKLQERSLEIIYECLASPNPRMRTNAIEVVSTTKSTDIMPVVVKLLKDEVVPVRFSAAVAIGDMEYSQGELSVKRLLVDPDLNVRIAAAYALTKMKKGEFTDTIYDALSSKGQTERANAVLLLGKLGDRKAIDAVQAVAKDPLSGDMVMIQAAESVAMLGGNGNTYRQLWALLMSKYADDRAMGIRAMKALATEEAQNAILSMLHDDVVEIRLLAAEQLAQLGNNIGEKEVEDYLSRVSGTLNEKSRLMADMAAVIAIGHMRSRHLADFLTNFIRSQSKDMQLRAAQSILLLNQ